MDEIRKLGDPVLQQKTVTITKFDRSLLNLAERMKHIMYASRGVGLAAPQIGISKKLFVYDDREGHTGVVCNPALSLDGPITKRPEGCLSIPPYQFEIPRHEVVHLVGQDLSGGTIEMHVGGYLAQIFQHETDHLNGQLYISYLPRETQLAIIMDQVEGDKDDMGEEGR